MKHQQSTFLCSLKHSVLVICVVLVVSPSVGSIKLSGWSRTGWESHPRCNSKTCLQRTLNTENTSSQSKRSDTLPLFQLDTVWLKRQQIKKLRLWTKSSKQHFPFLTSASEIDHQKGSDEQRPYHLTELAEEKRRWGEVVFVVALVRDLQTALSGELSDRAANRKSGALCPFFLKLSNHTPPHNAILLSLKFLWSTSSKLYLTSLDLVKQSWWETETLQLRAEKNQTHINKSFPHSRKGTKIQESC